jgi:hypothetical protein
MSIFDLLFIVLFLASVVTLLTVLVMAVRGRGARALRVLGIFAVCAAVYLGVVFTTALAAPRLVIPMGQDRCFDDWCIAITHADHDGPLYRIAIRLSSHAGRVSQREKGLQVYLTDDHDRRFDPIPDAGEVPFDVLLAPGESKDATRTFTVPPDARNIGLIAAHERSFCFPSCFIIGDDENPLHKPAVVPLGPVQ